MLTYAQINKITQDKQTELFEANSVFFAFSDSQVLEGMAQYNITDKSLLISLGAGMIAPRANIKNITIGLKTIQADKKKMVKERSDIKKTILYELNNYECFYTGDITDALEALSAYDVTREQVLAVYKENRNKYND